MQINSGFLANVRPRVLPNRCIHVKRVLLGKGSITVSKNAEISPHDVLGKYAFDPGFMAINIAEKLGVSRGEAESCIQRPAGAKIFKGELLALKKGLFGNKEVVAPTDGVIDFYDQKTGILKLSFISKELPLLSGVYGIVDDVNPTIGEVIIKTMVTELFGIVGSGKERSGTLNVLGRQGLVNKAHVSPDMQGKILVTASQIDNDGLKKAAGHGVLGVITGGINVKDYLSLGASLDPFMRIGNDVGITVVVTEGFGPVPIGDDIFDLIKSYDDKFVFLNGNISQIILPSLTSDSILSLRKIALPVSKSPNIAPEVVVGELKLGSRVRVIWPPYFGTQGKVMAIDQTSTVLESGITTFMLTIETKSQKIKVAYPNVEIIS